MKILLHSGPGLIGDLIRWQTRGPYSHASLLFPDCVVIEAREFRGVRQIGQTDLHLAMDEEPRLSIQAYEFVTPLTPGEIQLARTFAEGQLGKAYDYFDIFAFLTRARRHDDDAWFCSELVSAVCRVIGRPLFREINDWEVSPSMIARSLALRHIGPLV